MVTKIESADFQDFLSKCKNCSTIADNNGISAIVYEVLADNNETYILKIPYNNLRCVFQRHQNTDSNFIRTLIPVASEQQNPLLM